MKKLLLITVLAFTFFSCEDEPIVQIPTTPDITESYNVGVVSYDDDSVIFKVSRIGKIDLAEYQCSIYFNGILMDYWVVRDEILVRIDNLIANKEYVITAVDSDVIKSDIPQYRSKREYFSTLPTYGHEVEISPTNWWKQGTTLTVEMNTPKFMQADGDWIVKVDGRQRRERVEMYVDNSTGKWYAKIYLTDYPQYDFQMSNYVSTTSVFSNAIRVSI